MYSIFSSHNSFYFIFQNLFCSIRFECPCHLIVHDLITLLIFGEAPYCIMFSVLMYFLSVTSKNVFSQYFPLIRRQSGFFLRRMRPGFTYVQNSKGKDSF
jgi:hypothetical protein